MTVTKQINKEDINKTIAFALENINSVIPQGVGTSRAGQVVGNGIVVNIEKYYWYNTLEFNKRGKLCNR